MEYLARDDAPFSPEIWQQIDNAVVSAAKETLTGRRFLPLYGPLGGSALSIKIDRPGKEEVFEDGFASFQNRSIVQIPQLYEDFWIYWRDLAASEESGYPLDLSAAREAAQTLSRREDTLIFYGNKNLGIDGLLSVQGANSLKRSDWSSGEGAFTDVAKAMTLLQQNGCYSRYALVVSPDLYIELQRIQGGTGILESERIASLINGKIYMSTVLQAKTALLLCPQSQFMDLVVGQDVATAYTELVDLNHHLRVLETALPRIKSPKAIVVFK